MSEPSIQELVDSLLKQGFHVKDIRTVLRQRGVKWGYQYGRHQGKRERVRRMRLYPRCAQCDVPVLADRVPRLCDGCLAEKWA